MSFATEPRLIQGFLSGGMTTAPSGGQILAVMVVAVPGMIRTVAGKTNGSGAVDTIVDLQNNGTSVWKDPAKRLRMQAGVLYTSPVVSRPDHRSVQPGDILTLVVIQSGNNVGVAATAVIEYPG